MSSTHNIASPSCTIENRIPDFLVQRSGNRWYNKGREYFIALPTKITYLPEGACKDIVFMKHEMIAWYWESQSIIRIASNTYNGITTRLATKSSSAKRTTQPGHTKLLEIGPLEELIVIDYPTCWIEIPVRSTKAFETNEKLAPESNSINASNESIDMVPVTTSPQWAALADDKAYAPGIPVEEEGPENLVDEGVKVADEVGPP
jgi:hypothetical protein